MLPWLVNFNTTISCTSNNYIAVSFVLRWKVDINKTHMFLFQVTFVFTNQVDGKLVPIESTVRPKMQGAEENENGFKSKPNPNQKSMLFSQHKKPLQSVLCNGDSIRSTLCTFSKPLPRATMKSVTSTLKGSAHVTSKTKHSPGNQLPQKRLSPDTVQHDDDFA